MFSTLSRYFPLFGTKNRKNVKITLIFYGTEIVGEYTISLIFLKKILMNSMSGLDMYLAANTTLLTVKRNLLHSEEKRK